jgi:hypothetical protein
MLMNFIEPHDTFEKYYKSELYHSENLIGNEKKAYGAFAFGSSDIDVGKSMLRVETYKDTLRGLTNKNLYGGDLSKAYDRIKKAEMIAKKYDKDFSAGFEMALLQEQGVTKEEFEKIYEKQHRSQWMDHETISPEEYEKA